MSVKTEDKAQSSPATDTIVVNWARGVVTPELTAGVDGEYTDLRLPMDSSHSSLKSASEVGFNVRFARVADSSALRLPYVRGLSYWELIPPWIPLAVPSMTSLRRMTLKMQYLSLNFFAQPKLSVTKRGV